MLVWISLDRWFVTFVAIGYLALLFVIAYLGQKQSPAQWRSRPWIYSLALGVSCTSWAFYGTVGQAATTGAWLAPIYIGSILCLVAAWPMLLKILTIVKQQNLTSIADFIAFRYDRSPMLAAAIALTVLTGTVPYIALQLRAISTSFDLLTGTYQSGISTAFVVTLVLIVFSILFGTRQIAASKQNQGLMLAIAVSSVVKLFALLAVGIFATFYVFDGVEHLLAAQKQLPQAPVSNSYLAISQAILGAITIFILPQQFHMMMIENHHQQELKTARWLYPAYLLLINVFVLPIAIAGQASFPGGSVDADTFVLTLPLFYQQAWLGLVVFIGGLAAATSMVIVSAIVLSNMLSTEVITPLMLKMRRFDASQTPQLSGSLLTARRITIGVTLLLAFSFERFISQHDHLATIGLLSFVLLSQFAPATIGALYWRKGTSQGALVGLVVGALVWLYTLFLPLFFKESSWLAHGLFGLEWLKPTALFGLDWFDEVTHGVAISLLLNTLSFIAVSLSSHRSVGEKLQAELYISKSQSKFEQRLTFDDLSNLLHRFTNDEIANKLNNFSRQNATLEQAIEFTRLQLSGVLGSASTRMVMKAASTSQQMPLEDVVSIVDEANQMFEFNRELLQSGVENIEQGISVVDADMRIVAWNQRYVDLLGYPSGFVTAGKSVRELLQHNVDKGIISGTQADELVERRIEHMRLGHNHQFQRTMPNGVVLEILGQAMPGGGFVSTYSDITAHIEAEKALRLANENLEKRVQQRTQELENAKAEAEAANRSKTRFLAATSHDLMQPFNALSLFTSMLKNRVDGTELAELADHIGDSLNVVEGLLSDLVEISRLDSGSQKVELSEFAVDDVLSTLENEFKVLAAHDNIAFSYHKSTAVVHCDKRMLRRIIQNFLSNAVHYCNDKIGHKSAVTNKILLGVRLHKNSLTIEVWDNGPGISDAGQQQIFKEFERLDTHREIPGLGLGLAICDRMARILDASISIQSSLNKGTGFKIEIPRVTTPLSSAPTAAVLTNETVANDFDGIPVLVIDNDHLMLTAISSQLSDWGFKVVTAKDLASANTVIETVTPKLVIADYHLDNNVNGVDVVFNIQTTNNWQLPCIICSADPSEQVRQHTSDANYLFLRKPVKSLALKRLIKQLL
ncbi:PAS-domain containing protein [Psychrobium sp. nBUS_13]|uniref:PAS domain-containing hybrid sensor histidine kinase/response regulator n=1 Tax=Psychrobium sp. nBUS_13 TaxID=3395319 RepID=UPI003EBEE0F9